MTSTDPRGPLDDVDLGAVLPGSYLRADELSEEGAVFTVERAEEKLVRNPEKGGPEHVVKSVLHLSCGQSLVLNKTNVKLLAALCQELTGSTKTGALYGRAIVLARDPSVRLGPKVVGGIRLVGSPELRRDLAVTVAHPGRRPVQHTLRAWREAPAPAQSQAPVQNPAPPAGPTVLEWAQAEGHDVAALDALLVPAGKPAAADIPHKAAAKAIAWLTERLAASEEPKE